MFHEVEKITSEPRTFDFLDSGQGKIETNQINVDGVCLINNLYRFSFEPDSFQTILCECCGFSGCAPGSWACLRRLENYVVLVPAIEAIIEHELPDEYMPPEILTKLGPLKITAGIYKHLRTLVSELPPFEEIPVMSALDAMGVQKLAIPGRALGELKSPVEIRREVFIAASDGDLHDLLEQYESVLTEVESGDKTLFVSIPDKVIEFHLDLPGFPTWTGLGFKDGRALLTTPIT
ncbi:hypothetical protein [Parvularcula sp. IMCC14364]|uniref:hypothetical protein n=1 Tax=Parvularcula sp. IMCC14364 TaxID=3067902 RepID=UPI002741A5D9|nr:hypothetical protein [Parvularcula sp. IMCC14364]